VAAAVVLPDDFDHGGLNDSKKLTSQALALSFDIVCEKALGWAYSVKSAAEVDKINPLVASLAAMKEALEQIKITPALVLVDGNQRPPLKYFARAIVKGDAKSLSVAAASIVAKVIRDRLMEQEHERYPQYRFDLHKGYATKEHLEALAKFGPSPIHRLTYKGVVPKSDTGTVPKGPSLF
jgi:ribonuclease HII